MKNNEEEIPKTETRPDTIPVSETTNNLPIVISNFVAGEDSNVSSDPLSFSPAPRSIAGYIAPRKINITSTYGIKPPIAFPKVSLAVAISMLVIVIGSKIWPSTFSFFNRSAMIFSLWISNAACIRFFDLLIKSEDL